LDKFVKSHLFGLVSKELPEHDSPPQCFHNKIISQRFVQRSLPPVGQYPVFDRIFQVADSYGGGVNSKNRNLLTGETLEPRRAFYGRE
jgi:hypothetical protein